MKKILLFLLVFISFSCSDVIPLKEFQKITTEVYGNHTEYKIQYADGQIDRISKSNASDELINVREHTPRVYTSYGYLTPQEVESSNIIEISKNREFNYTLITLIISIVIIILSFYSWEWDKTTIALTKYFEQSWGMFVIPGIVILVNMLVISQLIIVPFTFINICIIPIILVLIIILAVYICYILNK